MAEWLHKIRTVWQLVRTLKNWPVFLHDTVLTHRRQLEPVTYHYRDGINVTVRRFTDDKWALTEVFMNHPYDDPRFPPLDEAPVIVDLGAHVGGFTLAVARQYPAARVYAFEASPTTFELLTQNIQQNHLHNVTPIAAAVAAFDGSLELVTDNTRAVFNSVYRTSDNHLGHSEHVAALSLPTFLERYRVSQIDWLKCDIEGSEYDMFRRLPASVWQKIRRVSMEFHVFQPGDSASELIRLFSERGFTILECRPTVLNIGQFKAYKDP